MWLGFSEGNENLMMKISLFFILAITTFARGHDQIANVESVQEVNRDEGPLERELSEEIAENTDAEEMEARAAVDSNEEEEEQVEDAISDVETRANRRWKELFRPHGFNCGCCPRRTKVTHAYSPRLPGKFCPMVKPKSLYMTDCYKPPGHCVKVSTVKGRLVSRVVGVCKHLYSRTITVTVRCRNNRFYRVRLRHYVRCACIHYL